MARHLIPSEQGVFELGHVKALLNLAQINLFRRVPEAALLLVGNASRILALMEVKRKTQSLRFKHTYSACFVLDTILSIRLGCQAYVARSGLEALGQIEENGIEEWAPWSSCLGVAGLDSALASQTRSPVLALSSFNYLCSLVSIMSQVMSRSALSQDIAHQLEAWRASLPPTFDCIKKGYMAVPATPPAVLLLLAYYCCAQNHPLQQSVQNIIGLLRRAKDIIGLNAMPAIILSLLDIYAASHTFQALDQASRIDFHTARDELSKVWQHSFIGQAHATTSQPITSHVQCSLGQSNVEIPTPHSLLAPPHPLNITTNDNSTPSAGFMTDSTFQTSTNTRFHPSYTPGRAQPNISSSQSLESFFDELASLDGVGGLDNQPQFMQNLGFAPGVDIAELLASDFGQFDPLQPSFPQQGDNSQVPFS
jgi:hypothetical protein